MPDSRGRILVVDDSRVNRMLLERALAQQGFSVAGAENGRQALERLGVEPYDVVLLDIVMPELDGYETLARIKQDASLRHIPVIMISAIEEMDSVVRCVEMGATDYLPKPFNPALLRARINASLAEKRLRDLEREYLEQVTLVTEAAAAVQSAHFVPSSLDRVAVRDDALGQLARVFQRMAGEVHVREQRLRQQLRQVHADVEEMRRARGEPLHVYVPMDRRQALARGASLPDRTSGAALLADISGFTRLTAALAEELGDQRGAEELTRLLNEVFEAQIAEVHRYGGSVIGFSGDAITCWFDGDDGPRAVACALAMQSAMEPFASLETPGGSSASLAIKVGVAAGPVRRLLVGDPEIQVVEVIAGRLLDELARTEQQARPGEVVVPSGTAERLGAGLRLAERRAGDESGEVYGVVQRLDQPAPTMPWPELPPDRLPDSACRPWLAPAVARRLSAGTRQFLAELRPAVALFIRFGGIDFETDESAAARLDAFFRWAQAVVHRHGGTLVQLTVGDKGSYLYAAFGAPTAHGDDELRAVQAGLELQSPPSGLDFVTGIGITKGRMRTGAYGSSTQRTYGVLGDKTNLAARLMQVGGGALCDEEVYLGARPFVPFEALPPVRIKGWAEPVAVYLARGGPSGEEASRAAIQARIDALAPAEQLTLKVASVGGPTFTLALLRALFPDGQDAAHLEEHIGTLERLGLIVRDPSRDVEGLGQTYSFGSPAVRETAYEGMLFSQRRQLHRLAAEWLERAFRDHPAPCYAVLAEHWRRADEPGRAIECLELAGRQAQSEGDFEQAERCLRQSLELEARSAVLRDRFFAQPAVDWAGAQRHALDRLERELPPELTYHSAGHTRDVLAAVGRLSAILGIAEEDRRLLETAAAFHDIGFTAGRVDHERLGCEIASQVLPGFGFSPAQVAQLQSMIRATRMPQSPQTALEEILVDADLDILGREDFPERSQALRDELAATGTPLGDEEWLSSQIRMFEGHYYRTGAARALREAGKRRNLETLRLLRDGCGRGAP